MKLTRLYLIFAFIFPFVVSSCGKAEAVFSICTDSCEMEITFLSDCIVHVAKYPDSSRPEKFSPSVVKTPEKVRVRKTVHGDTVYLSTSSLTVVAEGPRIKYMKPDGTVLLQEKNCGFVCDGESVSQTYVADENEAIFGLGQHQAGIMNWRGHNVHLEQVNMEIAMPVIHSSKGYALVWDNCSITDFSDNEEGMTFSSCTGGFGDTYFIYGGNADGVIAGIRDLTGQAPMFPLWSFGFFQSRERYTSSEELVGTVKRYRELGVPLDCIVQDWQYWGDNRHWNAVEFLNPSFPDPEGMMQEIKELNANAMISIWPSFGHETSIYKDLDKVSALMAHETFPQGFGVRNYDPWNPAGREIYWKYIKENMADIGMGGYWLDATEPEHNPIKDGDYGYQTGEGAFRDVRNSYPIVSVGGVYDNLRRYDNDKRALILTRSAFTGQQRYGTHVWSGDVQASWEVLGNQIPAALNMSLSGIPYWNSDIGGFYTWMYYPDGYRDPEYAKLYTRWMQFAVFTGMMRSHGTTTPREIWQFGRRGDEIFDVQEKFINLRYRMLPYIYSASWDITSYGASLMRHLMMDWPEDRSALAADDEFLFGKSLLVAPIVSPKDSRRVYLPEGQWTDFWTGEVFRGGASIVRDTPLDEIPLYVKTGTVLPVGPKVMYAKEKDWSDLYVRVYPGADGEFNLYEDSGDGYEYEEGEYSLIRMSWDDASGTLTIYPRKGKWDGMPVERTFRFALAGNDRAYGMDFEGGIKVAYCGKKTIVKL